MGKKPTSSKVLVLLNANPPNFGHILFLFSLSDHYEKIHVLIRDKPTILATIDVVNLLSTVLYKFSKKYIVYPSTINFAHINTLPKDDKGKSYLVDYDIITPNIKEYVNLKSKGCKKVFLADEPLGYHEEYHRIAYTRSLIYRKLKMLVGR